MEEKLKEILEEYEEKIQRHEKQVEEMVAKMDFCKEHKFEEEFRITNVQYQSLNMAVYRWRDMHNQIKELLNAWLS